MRIASIVPLRRSIAEKNKGNQVVVVVSAMGDTTDDLIKTRQRGLLLRRMR
jgi:aspartokinase